MTTNRNCLFRVSQFGPEAAIIQKKKEKEKKTHTHTAVCFSQLKPGTDRCGPDRESKGCSHISQRGISLNWPQTKHINLCCWETIYCFVFGEILFHKDPKGSLKGRSDPV